VKPSARIDRFEQRHSWVGFPLAVIYKYFDDQGAYLAALITYYGFLSLFPLLLLLVTTLGFTLDGNPTLRGQLLDSALAQFPGLSDQVKGLHSLSGNWMALIVGVLGSLYGALGVAQATQNALNKAWGVSRNKRPNPIRSRLRGLLFLVVMSAGLLVTTALSVLTTHVDALGAHLGLYFFLPLRILTVAANSMLFLAAFRVLTARDVSVRQALPGAVVASVAWQLLQEWSNYYVSEQVKGSSSTYGLFAVVLGLLTYIYLAAVSVVLAAEVNVVKAERLWPRSLLTPFTDDVLLTDADRRAYASYPESERHKGFEQVTVTFDRPDLDAEHEPAPAAPQDERQAAEGPG
jgi:YihY family inner membrane protein